MSEDIAEKIANLLAKAEETTDRGLEISDQISKLLIGEIGPNAGFALTMAAANFVARSELTNGNGQNCLGLFLNGVKMFAEAHLTTIRHIKDNPEELQKFSRSVGLDITIRH